MKCAEEDFVPCGSDKRRSRTDMTGPFKEWLHHNYLQLGFLVLVWIGTVGSSSCQFNSMCTCKSPPQHPTNSSRDISCVGVPFSRLPELSGNWIENIDVVEGGLEVVEGDSLALPHLSSLRLISNQIQLVSPKAFLTSAKVLRFLDLSYNKLENVPLEALRHLKALDWLNIHGNNIYTLGFELDWGGLRHSVSSVFLGENDLRDLGPDSPLAHCKRLQSVSLDSNKFLLLEAGTLPPNVHTLSASHNIIKRFPVELVDTLRSLSWLYLRGNFIETVNSFTFRHPKNLDKVDLGDNLLTAIPLDVFNNTMSIRDLNLDYNHFTTLPGAAFKGLNLGRISISMNRLGSLNDGAFEGIENTLEYLDLGGNKLQKMPRALNDLTALKFLYIPSNNLSDVHPDALTSFSNSLSALSIARNKLEQLPSLALKKCINLAHLNLGYNFIRDVSDGDFVGWGGKLDTLLLMNNRLGQIHGHTFKHTPLLRELSLSFNKIAELDPSAFTDVAMSLENLEISFGLYQEDFPDESLRPLGSLMWLALDNNNFRTISEYSLRPFRHLRYLNLDGNRLPKLPVGIFNPEIHRFLSDIRISYNHLQDVNSYMFNGLEELRALSLVGNQIKHVEPNAFKNLTNKITILLSENKISRIDTRAFSDIPYLLKLDLYNNELQQLSLSCFHNVTNFEFPMALNLSKNMLSELTVPASNEVLHTMFVHIIDLSFNLLTEVPRLFLESIGTLLRRANLGYNHINKLDESAFGALDNLEALILAHNSIVKLRKRAFVGLSRLQILDLSHNHIDQLHMEQFKHLLNLRVIDLSFNHLRSIPRDAFQNTKIERIDLSNNDFLVMPSGSLGEVGFTLRMLDISHNHIEHLDSTVFPETPHLTSLNLCYNRITSVPDNVFTSVGGLLSLELCGNKLRANFKEVFHYLQELRHLNLANTGILNLPILPLPNLVSLNVSHNAITELPTTIVALLPNLRVLDVSHCSFSNVPSNAWVKLAILKHLDISYNPIKVLLKDSMVGLSRLESLVMDGLTFLERVENDSLWGCRWLRRLVAQTTPKLSSIITPLQFLTELTVTVMDRRLTNQLEGLPPKLAHLEIRGEELKEVEPSALAGLAREAYLSIRGTSIEDLPLGLLSGLGHVTHLTLDLRDNKVTSLSPDTFYYNQTGWENVGTMLISGGLLLAGNPLYCDCSLVWIGHWLRRWVRESLVIHTADQETGHRLLRAVREATCRDRSGRAVPLFDLHPEHLSCHASALSSAARSLPWPALFLPVVLVLR